MKTLIAIVSCHTRPAYVKALRELWIPHVPASLEYKFFYGPSTRTPELDEVFLDCDDSYQGLPSKVRAITRWALEHDFDFMLKCDDDVVLIPERFAASGYEKFDFVGNINRVFTTVTVPWGFCYTLSKRAMQTVAKAELPHGNNDEAWCADLLYLQNIRLHKDFRYQLYAGRRESFVTVKKRPLRTPPRPEFIENLPLAQEIIAYCMFIHWVGYRELPEERNIEEMKKVFKEMTQSAGLVSVPVVLPRALRRPPRWRP